MGKKIEMIGRTFGRLTVKKRVADKVQPNGSREISYLCRCECGNESEARGNDLRSGNTNSCRCLREERTVEVNTKHGYSKHPLYKILYGMKQRCYNKKREKYSRYGGRGITICKEWLSDPEAFIKWGLSHGWNKGLQIDREDNDGNYKPSNCRFVTGSINSINRRKQKSNTSGYVGVVKFLKKWQSSITYSKTRTHIGVFFTPEDAVRARNDHIIKMGLPHKIQEIRRR